MHQYSKYYQAWTFGSEQETDSRTLKQQYPVNKAESCAAKFLRFKLLQDWEDDDQSLNSYQMLFSVEKMREEKKMG